ncbi:complement C3-like isoform X2 [Chiloscyllium punctatum]|uniref:complement C3-like isoform X2 n=1 Tax=Chiloscyllium punctatum TaxID=137246 RepID=UPI003B63D9FC
MELLGILLVACSFLPLTEQKISYLITAPKVVHIGMNETITVQVFKAPASVAITVYFEGQSGESQDVLLSQRHQVDLNQANNFTKVIHMQVLPEKTRHLDITHETHYAVLVAEIPFRVTRKTRIRLAPRPYFIYVITDKPIYKPHETVRYQVFTLDEELNPISTTVVIEVSDSQGNVLASVDEQDSLDSVHSGEISIQSEMTGRYQIRARVNGSSKNEGAISFQVQNYELPKFDVRIIPDHWHYLVTNASFSVTIQVRKAPDGGLSQQLPQASVHPSARSPGPWDVPACNTRSGSTRCSRRPTGFGQTKEHLSPSAKSHCDFHGNATFGITTVLGHRVPLSNLHPISCSQNRDFRVTLETIDLINNISQKGGMDKFKNGMLYIQAEISDKNGNREITLLDNISFQDSSYSISFVATKPYFTPGTDFYSLISVTYPNGSAAVDVPINVSVRIKGENILTSSAAQLTDQIGELGFKFMVPWNAETIEITAIAGDENTGSEKIVKVVRKHHSASRRYLHISVPHVLLYPGYIITVNLTAISQYDLRDVHYFDYMVLGKGKVLDLRRVERVPETTFDIQITWDMIPYFRIVAYYVVDDKGKEEIVVDSQWVEVESLCDEKFQVNSALLPHQEGYGLELSIWSDNPAEVFVHAVDPRLKRLHTQDIITMRKVFEDLHSYEIDTSYGSGKDALGVFSHSRLQPLSNLMPPLPEPAVQGQPKGLPLKRKWTLESIPGSGSGNSSLTSDKPPADSQKVHDGSGQRTVTIRPKKHRVHGAGVHADLIHPVFNDSSMWTLSTVRGTNSFRLRSDIRPPRTWEIHVLGLLEEHGLCLAKDKLFSLDRGHFDDSTESKK